MNYSEMSDFEINSNVGDIVLSGNWFISPSNPNNPTGRWMHPANADANSTLLPDYVNSWADAGPIIKEYLICLSPRGHDNSGMVLWTAFCKLKGAKTTNPLKSAMIAFLIMHDSKNE